VILFFIQISRIFVQFYVTFMFLFSSNVVYLETADTSKAHSGAITVQKKRSEPNNTRNADMIQHVKMTVRRH